MLSLLCTVSLSLVPQDLPKMPANPQMRYVDFSRELERPGTTAAIGRLGRTREGKRERIREGGRLGGGNTQVAVSGTQYYEVPVRARIANPTVLAGAGLDGTLDLAFDVQLARLPDGTEHRQLMNRRGTPLEGDMLALWIVEKPRKGKRSAVLHAIPFDPEADRGPKPEAAFADNMRDFCAINERVMELRQALAETEEINGDDARLDALERLRKLAAQKPEMRNPDHDALLTKETAPFERRVRDRIAELEKDGGP